MSLLNKEILNDKLYEDLQKFAEQDYRVNPDIFITNYLYFTSFFASDRIKLAVGNERSINSNLFVTIVGNSGLGKTYINLFFYKPIMNIQIELHNQDDELKSFANAFKNHKDSNENSFIDSSGSFVDGYNEKYNTNFDVSDVKTITPHVFTISDFTPEALITKFKGTRNHTILLNADEFEEMQNNLARTKTVENTFSFLTSFFDGKSVLITRKTQEDEVIEDAKLAVLANTVPPTLEKLKQSDFFASGLGYRYLFYINTETNIDDPRLVVKSTNSISVYDEYQKQIGGIFKSFFFNKVYMSTNAEVILRIDDDQTLSTYNECLQKLWNDHIKENENLKDSQKETFKSRLSTMLTKCILNTFIMNYSYRDDPIFPIECKDLKEDDILKGYRVYDYFLKQMVFIFDTNPVSDLTKTEQRIIELLPVGIPSDKTGLKDAATKAGISDSTFKRLMMKKSKQFHVNYNKFNNKQEITRDY